MNSLIKGKQPNVAMPADLSIRRGARSIWITGTGLDANLWFYNKTDEADPKKCPSKHGDRRPRYVKILQDVTKDYFTNSFTHDVYVSVSQIRELGRSNDGKIEIESDSKIKIEIDKEQDPAWIKEETSFVEEGCKDWEITRTTDFATLARSPKGEANLKITIPAAKKKRWCSTIRKLLGVGTAGSFRPTRQCTVPLRYPLLITPRETRKALVKSRFKMEINEFLLGAIKEANLTSIETGAGWTLDYWDKVHSPSEYLEFSVDPFNFYNTWIHIADWNSYMESLAPDDESPIRHFISLDQGKVYETLDELLNTVGKRDTKIQSMLLSPEYKKFGLNPDQRIDDVADASLFGRKVNSAGKKLRLKGLGAFKQKSWEFSGGKTEICIDLNVQKMNDAAGKRAKELSQKAVMGNISSSEIAKTLDWDTTRLGSGFFPSEWLHLAAFSWGGYMPADARSGFSTSQNLENLIFGTSETNSLMTRYEMAWQDFFRSEQQLEDNLSKAMKREGKTLGGQLWITCNDFDKPIRYDTRRNGEAYEFTEHRLDQKLVSAFEAIAAKNIAGLCNRLKNDPHIFGEFTKKQFPDSDTPILEMLAIANDFPFVVYSIEYHVEAGFRSELLLDDNPNATFTFFPFHRSLYHEAEAALDQVIWDKLKDAALHAAKK